MGVKRRSPVFVVLVGTLALAVLFGVGALVALPGVEGTLADAIEERLAEENIDVDVRMSGQDATLFCAVPIPALNAAVRYAARVEGVRKVALDPSCTTGGIPVLDSTPSTTIEVDGTVPTSSSTTTSTTTPPAEPVLQVVLADGRVSLVGSVATAEQHDLLLEAASTAAGDGAVDDRLTVDAALALDDADVEGTATVTAAMPVLLVSGEIGWDGTSWTAAAVAADDELLGRFQQQVDTAFATPIVVEGELRPVATEADATEVERLLNELVAAEPILFDKGAVTVSTASEATLHRAAAIAEQFGGLRIEVQGHTDSEGDAGRNLALSEQRAAATLDALVALGVPADDMVSKGYGETKLILDPNGREIPEKSRRVVFVVTLA